MAPSVTKSLAFAAVVSSATLLLDSSSLVAAHQNVILPAPTFTKADQRMNPLAFLEGQGFTPTGDFAAYLKQKGYASLRAFMDDSKAYSVSAGANFECGWTDPNGKRQPIPSGQIRSTGYTHDGPCEVWLDNTKVMSGANCHSEFPGKTQTISYASCKGKCTLRWYWLGMRFLKNKWSWQVYKNCVPIGTGRRLEGGEDEGESGFAISNSTTEV
ncbi:hypothetical protein Gpo141_00013211 [Globisporangium polare]